MVRVLEPTEPFTKMYLPLVSILESLITKCNSRAIKNRDSFRLCFRIGGVERHQKAFIVERGDETGLEMCLLYQGDVCLVCNSWKSRERFSGVFRPCAFIDKKLICVGLPVVRVGWAVSPCIWFLCPLGPSTSCERELSVDVIR